MADFAPDSSSVASSIKYHAEFTPSFSPERFELPKAYYAAAASVRDMLIINWNATNEYHEKANVKQAYYISMEYLQVGQSVDFRLLCRVSCSARKRNRAFIAIFSRF